MGITSYCTLTTVDITSIKSWCEVKQPVVEPVAAWLQVWHLNDHINIWRGRGVCICMLQTCCYDWSQFVVVCFVQECRSVDCVITGGEMLSRMNVSIDPCNDFYSYACESFIKDDTIPPGEPLYSTLSNIIKLRRDARIRKVSVNLFQTLTSLLSYSDGQIQIMIWFKSWLNHWW